MTIKEPILITGCARSGTSLVGGIVNLCGAFGGDLSGPNKNNKKGMFENHKIRNGLVKAYLRSIKADPLGQHPLPDVDNLLIPIHWKDRVQDVLVEQGYKEGPWFYKGAKMCLIWPVWDYAFPNAKWIIVRRKTADIVNSCLRTGFMRAYHNREGWTHWVHQHEKRFVEMIQAGLNAKVIWPERMVQGDYQQIYETLEWLGLEWNSSVFDFIEPKLWKARRK